MNLVSNNPILSTLLISFLFVSTSFAQEKRPIEIEDLLKFKKITEAQMSPDGQWVAFVVRDNNLDENKRNHDIWIVNPFGPQTRQLTFEVEDDKNIQWFGDGKKIAFLGTREEKTQVYTTEAEGGGATQATFFETNVKAFQISPDGNKIAIIAKEEKTEEQEELEKERGRPIIWGNYYDDEWDYLWVGNLGGGSASNFKKISQVGQHVVNIQWGPDSKQLVYGARPSPAVRTYSQTDLYYLDEEGKVETLTNMPGFENPVSWTEEHGLLIQASNSGISTTNRILWQVDIPSGVPAPITVNIDEHARFVGITEEFLFAEIPYKTSKRLYKIPINKGSAKGAPKIISDDKMFYSHFSISEDGKKVAFVGENFNTPPDIYQTLTEDFKPQIATEMNPEIANVKIGEQKVVQWKSKEDGELIEGILTLPVDYKSGDRAPLLLVIHGGPAGISTNGFNLFRSAYPIQLFANKGYAILQPNYRGSTGYGQRFRSLNRGDISGRDWIDIDSGVDEMIKLGYADARNLGIMGWSFGGHHTYWGVTQTNRFKAASAGAGANDLISMYAQTDIPEFYHTYLGPKPWENFNLYEERSAYRFVDKVETPMLIQVGEKDERVPAEQSIQFYEALQSIGKVETELIIYPDQPHGVHEPKLVRDMWLRNLEWFEKWVPIK